MTRRCRRSTCATSHKTYENGTLQGPGAARHHVYGRARRVRRDHGAVGLGEIDADEPRSAVSTGRPAGTYVLDGVDVSQLDDNALAAICACANSASSFRASICSRVPTRSRTSRFRLFYAGVPAKRRLARASSTLLARWVWRPAAPSAQPAFGRPATARRDRPRAHQRPGRSAGRRAYRQSRLANQRRNHGALRQTPRSGRTIIMVTHDEHIAGHAHRIDPPARRPGGRGRQPACHRLRLRPAQLCFFYVTWSMRR